MAEGMFDPLEFVQNMPQVIGDTVGGAVDSAGKAVGDVVEGAGEAIDAAKEEAVKLAANMIQSPLGVAGQIGGAIGTGAASVIEGAAAEWEEADGLGKANIVADTILDIGGFIPVVGIAFDGVHALKQAAQGDMAGAALYGVCAVPLVGDAVAVGKVGYKGFKAASKGAEIAAKGEKAVSKGAEAAVKGSELAGKGVEATAKAAEATAKGAETAGKGTFLDTAKANFNALHDAVRAEQAGWNKAARFFSTAPHEAMAAKIFGDLHTAKGAAKTIGTAGGLFGATEVAFGTVAKAFANEGDSAGGEYSEEAMQTYVDEYTKAYKEATGEEPTEITMPDGSVYDLASGEITGTDGSVQSTDSQEQSTSTANGATSKTDVATDTTSTADGQQTTQITTDNIVTDVAKQFGLDPTQPPISEFAKIVDSIGKWLSQNVGPMLSSVTSMFGFGGTTAQTNVAGLNSSLDSAYGTAQTSDEYTQAAYNGGAENTQVSETAQNYQEERVHADTAALDTSGTAGYDQQYY